MDDARLVGRRRLPAGAALVDYLTRYEQRTGRLRVETDQGDWRACGAPASGGH
jgi:hypothetical protein